MPQLDTVTFPSLLLWLVVGFGLLYLGLRYVILPKLSSIQEHRFMQIENILDKAESFRTIAKELEARIDSKKKALQGEMTALLLDHAQQLDLSLEASKKKFASTYESKKRRSEKTSERLYEEIHASLKEEIPELVRLAVDEIYGEKAPVKNKKRKVQ